MHELLLYGPLGLGACSALLLLLLLARAARQHLLLAARLDGFEKSLERTERLLREELAQSREENTRILADQRRETSEYFKALGGHLSHRLADAGAAQARQQDVLSASFNEFSRSNQKQLEGLTAQAADSARHLREEVVATLTRISDTNAARLETMRAAMEEKLGALQADNAAQLENMRRTVDEKLQGTLEKRLGESFRQVSERLEQVHKGLGEMQTLATGVGDLKKVLTNVKTRGTWGEVQLGALLEQVLSPEQFACNVATRGGAERVEFAIRLPGHDGEAPVLLPIDAKFPIEDYQRLLDAQERADVEATDLAGRQLETRVKACARDIRDKYVNPPITTDFGILFLPIEGLFAEVIRRPGLAEAIQRDLRVVIAGPTTLWSILNSLQMGFRTLAIQKRSSEVWNLLGAVKTEWGKYGEVLDAVQKKIHQASETLEKAKQRTRVIGRKLKNVQELPATESMGLLALTDDDELPADLQ